MTTPNSADSLNRAPGQRERITKNDSVVYTANVQKGAETSDPKITSPAIPPPMSVGSAPAMIAIRLITNKAATAAPTCIGFFRGPNIQECTEENRRLVESKGGVVLTAAHAFGGISRAMRNKFKTYVTGDIISNTLYVFGEGMKVACEIALMAADSGSVRTDEEIISIGGTGLGADTAVVLTPVNTRDFFDLKVKEILCKPRL